MSFLSFRLKTDPEKGYPQTSSYSSLRSRRRQLACISIFGLSFIIFLFLWNTQPQIYWQASPPLASSSTEHETPPSNLSIPQIPEENFEIEPSPLDPLAVLNGPPTEHFRDNLKGSVQYITSWPNAGWTNDVMTFANLVYLGLITERVPVIPPFTPSHVGWDVAPIAFGDVFDLPRMRRLIGKPIIEWRDVKKQDSETLENLGCWGVWESSLAANTEPRGTNVLRHLKLDISYTKTPDWIKYRQDMEHDPHTTFWTLARFAFPETRNRNLVTPRPSPQNQVSLPPDEQMLCYDYLYYVCTQEPFEWDKDWSASWRFVAQHMHWTPSLESLADSYIRRTMGIEGNEPTPPYISIHVRHNDFHFWCGDVPVEDCLAKLPAYVQRVREVQEEILEKKGISVNHVIVTSDEKDDAWWQEVAELGWLRIDHSMTAVEHGEWYPVLIDAVIQSGGLGFVGTDRSTMSVLAWRRVQDWHGGSYRMVRWGRPGADDH
ncbi:hypothetical protein D9758_002235 [Tetrapyrgos nigripes]|uniref:Uncharacterized protein n=1 Tax=Tetrapyrgos nigripes TaxID=182062 RepID=A0A8H5GNS6_9AGAR|nr:hypothetical protein D9758_002235 [Tetrapyrgos nigripes]